jgi:uncharacterized integral membrane protein
VLLKDPVLWKAEESLVKNPKTIAIIVVFVLFLIFLVRNRADVTLDFLFGEVSIPKIILIPIVLLVGFACGFVVGKLTGRKKPEKPQTPSPVL